ncbi:uncharacterized protein LOC134267845 [Saccostrea cucullata]|uniref:uncharacterized protein LOC134267845 n=1 Tax=Saccostrea cuccullata TaxID=36930 RepID=UPI002ED057A0
MKICFTFLVTTVFIITMATGGEKASDHESWEEEIEKGEKDQEKLIHDVGKIDPKYKVITKEEYEYLMAMKASTPLTGPGKGFPFPSSPIPGKFQPALNPSFNMSTLQSNFNTTPKLPTFSGSEELQKGEVTYEVWSFEVRCLRNSQVLPDAVLLQTIRNSLKGTARSMLISLGESATTSQILEKLEGFYGMVSSSETLMQQFYNDCQKENESIVAYGSRLESTLCKAIKQGHIDDIAKDTMLCSKFWTGLRSKSLRNSTRYIYANITEFQVLLREIRKVEQEEINMETVNKDAKSAALHSRSTEASRDTTNQELLKAIKGIERRLENLEKKQGNVNNFQFVGRGRSSQRGFYRGQSRGRGWSNRGKYTDQSNQGYPKE